jgi:hypothetical protein
MSKSEVKKRWQTGSKVLFSEIKAQRGRDSCCIKI